MATDHARRNSLKLLMALGASLPSPWVAAHALASADVGSAKENWRGVIGCAKQDAQHYVVAASSDGELRYQLPMPARGHQVALSNDGALAACVARRPGDYLMLFDPLSGRALEQLSPPNGLCFNGHAVFVGAERLLVSAAERQSSQGWVLHYQRSRQGWCLSERWVLPGLGPHQLLVDGEQLVVALGGIHTQGRTKLNLDSLQPALLRFSLLTGELLDTRVLADKSLSIRHISRADDGRLWLACQAQRESSWSQSLVFSQLPGQPLQALDAGGDYWELFNGYVGSIECFAGSVFASSPRGHLLGQWSQQNGELLSLKRFEDVCGIAATSEKLAVSSGRGWLASGEGRVRLPLQWDNHLSYYSPS
ncbi:DUF1513 domain-containing protein [Aliagarivorans taiwanensis]|uniref:DUF1513 domain-containing protein n=1 Tax=Aliagarivorans taiwanensis TaxID=561966 RepID=UPI00047ABB16|nr:DUF1513 domain-containing protein [Aliagarivorans taiwanensis]